MTEKQSELDLDLMNREFLSERFPKYVEMFSRIESKYLIEYQEGGTFFKTQAGRYLLRQPDHEYSEMRVDAFLEKPPRLSLATKGYGADSIKEVWDAHIKTVDLPSDDARWGEWPGISESLGLILFDIGCLDSVAALVADKLEALTSVKIFITDFDFFFARLKLENWVEFFDYCDSRDISVELAFTREQQETISALRQFVWTNHLIFPDNILCYFHFAGPPQKALWRAIRYEYMALISGLGFFDDEMVMFTNSRGNLLTEKSRLLSLNRETAFGRAIVVGSGPSLDRSIREMRHLFDNAFVVAAGTAVEPLLRASIAVDVCVILERGDELVDIYQDMAKRVDLASVYLVASSTVAVGLDKFFKDTAYFFRPGLNVCPGFGASNADTLYGCDPTVSNTALAFCTSLNFSQILMFGVDMGTVDLEHHHSKQTAYHTGSAKPTAFDMPAVSEFGGLAFTNRVLQWARQCIENLIKSRSDGVQILNFSDGVAIKHSPSLLPNIGPIFDHCFPVDSTSHPRFENFSATYDLQRLSYEKDEFSALLSSIRLELADFGWSKRAKLGHSLSELLYGGSNKQSLPMIVRGSLYLLIWHAFSVLSRLEELEREAAETAFRSGLLAALSLMEDTIKAEIFSQGLYDN